jgi:hypothetical protein
MEVKPQIAIDCRIVRQKAAHVAQAFQASKRAFYFVIPSEVRNLSFV